MDIDNMQAMLESFRDGRISLEEALDRLKMVDRQLTQLEEGWKLPGF